MPRKLRFHPEGALVEVTCRTVQGRFLLRPTTVAKDLILGIVGRAQRLYEVEIVAMTFLSSHYHMLLVAADAERLADFVGYVNSNVARKVGHLVGWRDDTKAYRARQRKQELAHDELYEEEVVSLTPLPCWRHLGAEEYRARVVERSPHERPARLARSPAPLFHADPKPFRTACSLFYAAFRQAAERPSRGDLAVAFPRGSFPPTRSFVVA